MTTVHASAMVETDSIGDDVVIGAQCIVGPDAVLGDGVRLHPHVVVDGEVSLGDETEVFAGALVGRTPARSAALSRPTDRSGPVTIGQRCSIGSYAVIYGDVEIGADCLIGDLASLREHCRVGDRCIVGRNVSLHPDCHIGDGTRIYDSSHIATGARLGRRCFLGVNVTMTSDNALGQLPFDHERVRGAVLGDGVAIGSAAVILPALEIGADATVASGAVVTRDVAAGTSVRGRPARPSSTKGGGSA
ncbi:MAG TPA: DapH/DapD/GlmU-related protein [Acidimicrobiia bacterium]